MISIDDDARWFAYAIAEFHSRPALHFWSDRVRLLRSNAEIEGLEKHYSEDWFFVWASYA